MKMFIAILSLLCSCNNVPLVSKKINLQEFSKMVAADNKTIETKEVKFDSLQSIHLIKLYNTISYYLLQDTIYAQYSTLFEEYCLNKIVNKMGCKMSLGMGYYCPKANIYIGGTSTFIKNNYYEIEPSDLPKNSPLPHSTK